MKKLIDRLFEPVLNRYLKRQLRPGGLLAPKVADQTLPDGELAKLVVRLVKKDRDRASAIWDSLVANG